MDVVVLNENLPIICDFDELTKNVQDIITPLKGVVYTEDQQREAKKDRASLNKLAKEMNAKKLIVKSKYMQPYLEFEEKVKALIYEINDVSENIDKQVKEMEEIEVKAKRVKIKGLWRKYEHETQQHLDFDTYYNTRWDLKSYSLSKIEKDIIDIFLDNKFGENKDGYIMRVVCTKEDIYKVQKLMRQMELQFTCEKELDL